MRSFPALLIALPLLLGPAVPARADAGAIDLQVDADRSGAIDRHDEAGEDAASVASGALVLPNLDDDAGRCQGTWTRELAGKVTVNQLVACSDAQTPGVDGRADAADMAPVVVRAMPGVPDGSAATIALTGPAAAYGRLHGAGQDGPAIRLDAATLRRGITLSLEALDVADAHESWGGVLEVHGELAGASSGDDVRLRVAPLILASGAADAKRLYVPTAHRSTYGPPSVRRRWASVARYDRGLPGILRRAAPHVPVSPLDVGLAPFVQDYVEVADAAVPRGKGLQRMQIAMIKDQAGALTPGSGGSPAIRALMTRLRALVGPDRGILAPRLTQGPGDPAFATAVETPVFNPSGALESTPPVAGARHGKILLSAPVTRPGDVAIGDTQQFGAMLGNQLQPLVELPLDWLTVGHVDEIVSFVPAATPRGWVMLLADPREALNAMHGHVPASVRTGSGIAATHIAAIERTLRTSLGLRDRDIVRIPVLFETEPHAGNLPPFHGVVAWSGNTVNGLHISGRRFLAPRPNRPVGGRDVLATLARRALAAKGVQVTFVDTFPEPHELAGELHCTTNAERVFSDATWWLPTRT